MRASSTLTEQQREHLVDLFEQGVGHKAAASELRLKQGPVRSLYRSWQLHGRLCLMEKRTNAVYSFEIKKEIVDRHMAGETKMDLAKEFNLSSHKLVERWSKQHREGGDEALIPKPKGRPKSSEKPVVLSEEDKLRRELKRVQAENAYLKKLRDLRNQRHA